MRQSALTIAFALALAPLSAQAVGPTVSFTLPAANTTPGTFGSLPFPCDLYFDQGQPGDGDGTLLNTGASIGLGVDVVRTNTASVEDALDLMDGFGTTSAIYFFFDGPIDVASLPASPVTAPSLGDSVFCADAATATPVPIEVKFDFDTRIPNVLAVVPLPGRPLAPVTTYTCVVRDSVTGGGGPVQASADWTSVRDGASANGDADAIFDPVVTTLGGHGVLASQIAGMTVFTTQSTTVDLQKIRDVVLPGLPVPTADLTSRPELVFDTPAKLQALLGRTPVGLATIATGYYDSARFQTHDPNGDGPVSDLPIPPSFVNCLNPCETTDERFTRDLSGVPIVIDTPEIPFTVVIPSGTPPPGGWPVVIQQHGLGGQRDTVVAFAEADAAAGFASIGIDAAQHGYRYFDCKPAASCSQDTANNLGGTAIPDGFVDGSFAGFSVSFLTVNLGFFQAFHNFIGIRDNFRQTYVDLLSLVRLLKGHSIDTALGTTLDDGRIFYMGHSLGALMGAGFVPIEPDLQAALLNAAGGGLTNELFINSSIGAGAQTLVTGVLGLDPANPADRFAFQPNLVQGILDPGDGINSASLLLAPDAGAPRNVIQVEDFGDQVVPNQSNEALALAAGLPIFDPFVQNLHQSALSLPIANAGTPKTVSANAGGGLATAVLLQNGPATHAASVAEVPGTLTFVPEFAHLDDFLATGNGFPNLVRGIRIMNAGILDEVLAWFRDIADHGPPGTFTFSGDPDFNPIENLEVPAGPSTSQFFARTVDAGGALAAPERLGGTSPLAPTTVILNANSGATRLTAGRTILGTTASASGADLPPGSFSSVGTPGILPFFVTFQSALPVTFDATLALPYRTTELALAGIPPGSAAEGALAIGRFVAGTCSVGTATCAEDSDCGANGPCVGATYDLLPTGIDTNIHRAVTVGVSDFGIFALLHPNVLTGGPVVPLVPGGGSARTDCGVEWELINPLNVPYLDRHGLVSTKQACTDGDPTCDADRTADGNCTFRVALCFNNVDAALPACVPGSVDVPGLTATYRLIGPSTHSKKAVDRANAEALLNELVALGGSVDGRGLVTFASPLGEGVCSGFAELDVPAGAKKVVRGVARPPIGHGDADRLRLQCVPAS